VLFRSIQRYGKRSESAQEVVTGASPWVRQK
jgi:hypothetical protein